jgi:hypothetical protein
VWYRLLIGTGEGKTERWNNVVCGSVVLEAKRCMRIKMGRGTRVVNSGGLMMMETITFPRVGGSPDPSGGRDVL